MSFDSLIVKKHLISGEEIRGYGWRHFVKMYNHISLMNGYDDFISEACTEWSNHVDYFNSKKKEVKQKPKSDWTVDEIKSWLKDNKFPFKNSDSKKDLLDISKSIKVR